MFERGFVFALLSSCIPHWLPAQADTVLEARLELFQRVDPASVVGADASGLPMVCGTGAERPILPLAEGDDGFQEWEVFPSVVRADSKEPIYIKVRPNRLVDRVRLVLPTSDINLPDDHDFNDEGLRGDEVAGDGEYTLGPLTLLDQQSEITLKPTVVSIGFIQVTNRGGSIRTFTIDASVGVLPTDHASVRLLQVTPDTQITSHLVNARRESYWTQDVLRGVDIERNWDYFHRLYEVVLDDYDTIVLLSSGKVESTDPNSGVNVHSGIYESVRNSELAPRPADSSASYGSDGKLVSICALDYQNRGMYPNNLMHEILHRWGAHLNPSLGLGTETGHYDYHCNAGSLIGGLQWTEVEGGYVANPEIGRAGAFRASPVDLFSMGLLPLENLPDLHLAPGVDFGSGQNRVEARDITLTVAPEDIRAAHPRGVPDTENPQTYFRILFVIESKDRLLNSDEMTYYSAFIQEAMRQMHPAEPDPYLSLEWVPITRFFGERVKWDYTISMNPSLFGPNEDHDGDGYPSALECLLRTNILDGDSKPQLELEPSGSGYRVEYRPYTPNVPLRWESSSDLVDWIEPDSVSVENGVVSFNVAGENVQFVRTAIGSPE